jgi:hypothetical protein
MTTSQRADAPRCAGPGEGDQRCPNRAKARGVCPGHYAQLRRGVPLTPLRGPHGRETSEVGPLVSITSRITRARAKELRAAGRARGYASLYRFTTAILEGREQPPSTQDRAQ